MNQFIQIIMERIEIENLVRLQSNNTQTLNRFSIDQLVKLIDKNMLLSIENIYRIRQDGFDMLQFTRFFMNCIEHSEVQSPYLAAGLGQLYQAISNGQSKVKFSQFTDFICQYILEEDRAFKQLEAKWIPIKGHIQQKLTYLKNPPLLKGHLSEIYKVSLDKQNIDNSKHQNIISHACYSENNKNMYCLESLADWIGVYNPSSKLQKIIKPSALRAKKDLAVISICFSENEERLGAVLKDFSISFWDVSDKFTFQKSINTTKYCQQLQNNIWYLQFFQKWVTSDIDGKIYLWNLLKEMPSKILQCVNKSKISDICEVPSIRLIAVAQEQKGNHTLTAKIQLMSLQKGEIVTQIDTKIQRRMLHTLRYSEDYQMLLTAGYQKKISMFQINNVFLDSSLRGELLGHQSAITTFTLIKKTPMVVSADDRGKVKIWNIRNFKCVQTIDFSDKVAITNILDMANQKKICLMGSRIILLNLQKTPQTIEDAVPLKAKYLMNELLITTVQDFRKIDFKTGKLKVIDCSYNKSVTDITFITVLSRGEVVTGNQKGEVNFYSQNTDELLQTGRWHSGSIQFIQEDFLNKQLLTYSDHSGFIILGREHNCWEHLRELKCNFVGKQATSVALSPYHYYIAFIHSQTAYICDYQTLKTQYQFCFQGEQPTAVSFINGLGIILISTSQGRIYVYQIDKDILRYKLQIECPQNYITHMTCDLKCREVYNETNVKSCQISCSFEDGTICIIDFADYAKKITFKSSKAKSIECNHTKQIRESFQNQIKKHIFKEIHPHRQQTIRFQGKVHYLEGHKQGVTSLNVVQFDQPLLVSTGNDKRVKLWKDQELVGDLNINLPLPYLWKLQNISQTKTTKRILQGLQLIQILFKRFAKDISLGQAQIFKLTSAADNYFDNQREIKSSKQYLKKKPTLFQQQFTEIDLNYERIKKEKILQLGGLSLKKMELTKKIEDLQQDWYISKETQQISKKSLLKTIIAKQQKNDEKQKIALFLKGNYGGFKDKEKENNSAIKKLEQKLEAAIQIKVPQKNEMKASGLSKAAKEQYLKFSVIKQNVHRKSCSKQTLQSYFAQKYKNNREMSQTNSGFRQTRGQIRNSQNIKQSIQNSFHNNQYKKEGNFRIILKELKQKLSRSKKGDTQRLVQSSYSTKRHRQNHVLAVNRQIVNELDHNIHSFTTK